MYKFLFSFYLSCHRFHSISIFPLPSWMEETYCRGKSFPFTMGYHPFSVSSDMMVSNMITFSQYALNYIGFMPDTSQKTLLEHDMGGF